jgi:hypothetical protein
MYEMFFNDCQSTSEARSWCSKCSRELRNKATDSLKMRVLCTKRNLGNLPQFATLSLDLLDFEFSDTCGGNQSRSTPLHLRKNVATYDSAQVLHTFGNFLACSLRTYDDPDGVTDPHWCFCLIVGRPCFGTTSTVTNEKRRCTLSCVAHLPPKIRVPSTPLLLVPPP